MIYPKPSEKCRQCYDRGQECDCHCHSMDLLDCEHYNVYHNPIKVEIKDESKAMEDNIEQV